MTTVFVFDIGPVKVKEGALHVLAASPGNLDIPVVHADTLSEAFAQMAPACAGHELTCAPELEVEGKKLGFVARPWTSENAMLAAAMAFHLAMSKLVGPLRIPGLIDEYLKAAAELWKAPMREGWSPRDLIWFGSRGSVLGTDVLIYGDAIIVPAPLRQVVVFYDHDAGPYLTAVSKGESLPPIDYIAIGYDRGPANALDAINRALDLPAVPRVALVRKGQQVPLSDVDLAFCTGVLRAMKSIDAQDSEKRIVVESEIEPGGRSHLTTKAWLGPMLVLDEQGRLAMPETAP